MLANFYTFDGKANQFAWTGNSGGIIDGSNAKTDLIMQGNFNGTNNGGSNLFGGSANNAFLAGSGDNVYLGTGKNDVYLNKNREDKIGVGIYAYDNLIGDSSSGDSSDLAENIDGESADATGEKNYSSVVNNFKFGFDYDSDILYISGKSSSRDIKQNFIEPLKEMFASLVDEINDAENDSTENSSADLAESAIIINRQISAVNKNSLNAISVLRQSNRQVDLISQAAIGVNTNAISAKWNELQSRLTNLRNLMSTSINDSTNNTSSTLNLSIEEMRQQSQQINENSTSVQDNINNATPTMPDALNLQQNNTTTKGLDILSGNGDTKANIDLPQRNTTSDQTQNNPAHQQLQQQAQQIAENAPIISLDTPLFAGGSSSGTGSDLTEDIDGQSADATGEKNYSTTVNGRRPSIVLTKAPKPRKSVRNNNGDIIYNGKVNLKKISGISGDEADGSALGTIDYEKLILGYEDGTVKTAVAGQGAVINLDWNGDERAEEYIGENSGVDVGEYEGTVAINLNTGVGVLDGDEAIIIGAVDKLKAGSGAAMFVGSATEQNTLMGGSGDSSIWGGGNSKDLLVGYSGEDKFGSTNFFYVKGDGKDTIENFAYLTSDNDYKADEINFLENSVTKIHIDGKDVYLTVENDDDVLKLTDAVGKDFKVRNNNTAVIAQVGTDKLTYDGRANYFYAAGKNATLTVDGSVQTAEIWLNGAKGEYYTGDIKVLDKSFGRLAG